jgi:hypothetical protein
LQQKPSTQWLFLHSRSSLQVAPSSFNPHCPIWQCSGAMHWPSIVHESKQAVPPVLQTNGAQSRAEPGLHFPWPSQVDSPVYRPVAHLADTQTVAGGYFLHPPLPLQVPSFPQLAAPWSLHSAAGSTPPARTGWQLPALPARLHEKQLAVQAVRQQTPWAQKPDMQSVAFAQTAPGGRFPHDPFTQTLPAEHCALVEQVLPQPAPLQRYGVQALAAGEVQAPLLQTPSAVTRLVAVSQLPGRQTMPVG